MKTIKQTLALFLMLLISNVIIAQQRVTVSLKDEDNKPIEMGNIMLLSKTDSSLVNGTYFMDGKGELDVSQTDGFIKITAIGYNQLLIPLPSETGDKINLGEIKLTTNTLDEFTVVEDIPLFEQRNGSTIVNVEKTMLSSSSNVKEVLAKSPGVLVKDDQIEVVGKGDAILYLNGKRITIDRLNSIPVSQLKKLEIISNPGAQYDAEGMAVINIKLKENHLEGHQVNLLQHFTKGMGFLSYSVLGYNYQKNKISLTTDFNINLGSTGMRNESSNRVTGISDPYSTEIDYKEDINLANVSNALIGVGYKINENHSVSAEYNGGYWDYKLLVNTIAPINYDSVNTINIFSENNAQSIFTSHSGSLNYTAKLDTLGSTLFFGAQAASFLRNLNDVIDEEVTNNETTSIVKTNNSGMVQVRDYAIQTDFQKTLKNQFRVDLGVKYAEVLSDNLMDLQSFSNGENTVSIENAFEYKETNLAGYGQLSKSLKKKEMVLGIRSEKTITDGYSVTHDSTMIDRNNLFFFPSASLSYPLGKVKINHSYASRINRPSYESLNPFYIYFNNNMSFQGNPNLLSEQVSSFETSAFIAKEGKRINTNFKLTTGYSYTKNPVGYIVGVDQSSSLFLSPLNLDKKDSYYGTLNTYVSAKRWSSYHSGTLKYEQLYDDEITIKGITPFPEFYYYGNIQLKLNKLFNIELSAEYVSKSSDGVSNMEDNYSINLGINKSLMKDKLYVQLVANDIFHTSISRGGSNLYNVENEWENTQDTQFFRLLIKYSFGNLRHSKYKNVSVNEEGNNRVRKQ
tara:strand:+ start:986 stop:3373 length:2388 start_codon:yes stop_codon:yes gene_type:complete